MMSTASQTLKELLDRFDRETIISVIREKGLMTLSERTAKSGDCGPTGPNTVIIKDVEGEGADAKAAMANAHNNAKGLGQTVCDGGSCQAATVCKYVEDSWTATAPVRGAQNTWIAKGTTSGHCNCE